MSRFNTCAKVAHAKLRTFFPQICLGQTQQLLSAALGHKTYASFLVSDKAAFDGPAAFAVLAPELASLRALEFGIQMNRTHWSLLMDELGEKRVVGDLELCVHLDNVYWRARYDFYETADPRIDTLLRPYGAVEVFRQIVKEACQMEPRHVDVGGILPASVHVTLEGEICCEFSPTDHGGVAVPVLAKYGFESVGRRLIGRPMLLSIEEHGSPRDCHPYEELDDMGGMTFDGGGD